MSQQRLFVRRSRVLKTNRQRQLLIEQLENRRLLTTADVSHTFRSESFSIQGDFSYFYVDPDERDSISNGNFRSTSGDISWEGPQMGSGNFAGIAEGSGAYSVRIGEVLRACSLYQIRDAGGVGFDVDALNESFMITSNFVTSTLYTSWTDLLGGNCPQPEFPPSVFFGGTTNKYAGKFFPADSTAMISYRDAGLAYDLTVNSTRSPIVWANNGQTELTLTVEVPPPEFEVPDGWVIVSQTSEPPDEIDFIDLDLGIKVIVDVQGRPLPVRGSVLESAARVKLFWYSNPTGVERQEIPVEVNEDIFALYWNSKRFEATIKDFPDPPSWAQFVSIEVETVGSEIASNNSKLLRIEKFEASNEIRPQITEDMTVNGLASSILNLRDSTDPDVKLYAYNPRSRWGASVFVADDRGGFFYSPLNAPEIQKLRPEETLLDAMDFVAVKYQSLFSSAVHLQPLQGVNDLPVVTNEEEEIFADATITIVPAANDTDIDLNDTVSLHSVPPSSVRGAKLTRGTNGEVLYDPSFSPELRDLLVNSQLEDTFQYEVIDTHGGISTGIVTITVKGVRVPVVKPSVTIVIPQFTIINRQTTPIPFVISHPSVAPEDLQVSGRSLRPDVVADDQILFSGTGSDRSVVVTPSLNRTGRVPVQITVTAPDGQSGTGLFQLFVGTPEDQDLDGITNEVEDRGAGGGDANGDGIPDRFQAHVLGIEAGTSGKRFVVSVPQEHYFQAASWDAAPPASGVANGAQFPLGLFYFSLELPAGQTTVDMVVTSDDAGMPINSAFFYSENVSAPAWKRVMRNTKEGVLVRSDRLVVRLFDGGMTDDGTAGDGRIAHALGIASVVNPWQNAVIRDVNNDGATQPIDALIILNMLNRSGERELSAALSVNDQIPYFLDVSGDRKVTPVDALIVINWLNRNSSRPPNSEGEAGTEPPRMQIFDESASWDVRAEDWPQWMGPGRDNVWRDEGILEKFADGGPRILWKTPIAGGYSGPAVAGGRVFITDYVTAENVKVDNFARAEFSGVERVLCLQEETGELVWKHEYPVRYTVSYPAGPRCTPLVDGDRVYTLGTEGNLLCLQAETGKISWAKDLKKSYGTKAPLWGYSAHPLIDGNRLLTLAGGKGSHLVALDKITGEELWRTSDSPETGYSPPTIIEYAGVRQLIMLQPNAVVSVDAQTGQRLWSVPYEATNGSIIMSPVMVGEYLYVAGYNNHSLLLKMNQDLPGVTEVWRDERNVICPVNVQPFVVDDVVYGMDQRGVMRAIKIPSGERLWESNDTIGQRPSGSETTFMVRHKDRFVLFNELGELIFAQLTPAGYTEIDRAKVIEPSNVAFGRNVVWSMPAFANRHAYIRNDQEIICVDLEDH